MPHYTKPLNKVIGKLKKASKAHASQAKTLTKIMKDQKKGYKKVDCIRMKTLKTQLASSSPHLQMQEPQLQKLKRSISLMRERYKYLQSVNKELK